MSVCICIYTSTVYTGTTQLIIQLIILKAHGVWDRFSDGGIQMNFPHEAPEEPH